ncbi:MAG: PKD domain-containing protein [Methanobacteriota archaeon]
MKRIQQSAVLAALLLILVCWGPVAGNEMGDANLTIEDLSSQPVQFIKNVGQSPDIILYQAKSQDFSFDFTSTGIMISGLPDGDSGVNESEIKPLMVTLEGAQTASGIEALDQLPGYANFLKGQNESAYQRYVPWYGSIRYPDILPGVNLTYSGKNGVLKREYQVLPGADPSSIRLKYEGAENITLTNDGTLIVRTPFGNLTEAAPFSYQEINGTRINVSSEYTLLDDEQVGFIIGTYNSDIPLVIDPYLEYSTYLGGWLEDYGMDIAMDASGNAYVTGFTSSCDFPVLNPIDISAPIRYNGTYCHNSRDAFVTKLTQAPGGNATIAFSTFIGGTSSDFGRGIAVDSLNNIYITGDTFSSDFPVMLPIQNGGRLHGLNDAFVMKIRDDGANFWYSSYLGGNFADQANDIALDSLNAAYITGSTVGNSQYKKAEENFPVTSGAYQVTPNTDAVMGDAFASKISTTGNSLEYSTYISGNNQDSGNGIAVDGQGMAYIIGTTSSSNLLPSGVSGYQKTLKGGQDAFLFKMNFAAGSPPGYATYLGGSTGYDYGEAVAVDTANCAYVTGATASTDFPVTLYAKQKEKGWKYDFFEKDAYVTKFSTDGSNLEYSTYLGGSSNEWAYGIAVDNSHRAYVTGYTKSESFPVYDSIKTKTSSDDQDGFLTCVNADGSNWVYSTVFGGYRDEISHGVAVSNDGNTTLLTGWTSSPSIMNLVSGENCYNDCFPVMRWINQSTYPPPDTTYFGGNFSGGDGSSFDAFVMKFGRSNLLPLFSMNLTACNTSPFTILFIDNSGSSANIVQRIWNFGDGNVTSFGSVAQNVPHTYTSSGIFQVTLTLISYSGSAISDPVAVTVCPSAISANFTVPGYNNTPVIVDVPWKTGVSFSGTATNYTPVSWQWSFGDGTANATGQNVVHQFNQVGNFNVILTPLTGTCCNYTSVTRPIRVMAPPYSSFVNRTGSDRLEICATDKVSFNDTTTSSSINSSATAWEWDFGDNTAKVTTQNVTDHQFLTAGNFTVSMKASNIAGSNTATKTNYVTVYGAAVPGFEASPVTNISPMTVNFTDRSTGVPTYWFWEFGDSPTSTSLLRNPSHTYTQPGVYTVNLSVSNKCGGLNKSSLQDYITVNGNISPTLLFNATSPALYTKYNGTVPLTVFLQGNTSVGTLIDQASWDFGDGNVTTQTRDIPTTWPEDNTWVNQSHIYSVIGDYTPVLRVSNNTWPGTASTGMMYNQSIGVAAPMTVSYTVTPPSGVTTQQIRFTDTSTGSPTQWYWLFGDGGETNSSSSVQHSYASTGLYPTRLYIWNKYGQFGGWANQTVNISNAGTSGQVIFNPSNLNLTTGVNNWRKVQLTLNHADYGLSSFTVKLDLNSTSATNFGLVADRPWWIDVDKWAVTATPSGHAQYLTLVGYDNTGRIGYGSQNVSLGNITLFGSAAGNAMMSLNTSVSIAQYGSSFMSLSPVSTGIRVDQVGALLGYPNPPNDLKPDNLHDGLLDDFDGNGVVNSNDVTTFFLAYSNGALTTVPVAPFDYNYNGRIDTDDIAEFFNAYIHW